MLYFKVITYTLDLINKSTIDSVTLLTKDGKRMSILTGNEYGNVIEHVATYDESIKTFIVENPVINGTTEYDEAKMLDMFDGALIQYAVVFYNGEKLFIDDIWFREVSLWNDERYVSIERAIPRNFWNHAFKPFKAQQLYENRNFDACYHKALAEYQRHDMEGELSQYDSDDTLAIARAIEYDVWNIHDILINEERERHLKGV